jgi:Fe-S cluster biogenesis protein NfuA
MNIQGAGERIEQILTELEDISDPVVRERTEELVRTLLAFYGAGLARVVTLLAGRGGALDALAADGLVGGLLALHDLHPRTVNERVAAALERVRPYLGAHAGDVELIGVDAAGVARLRLTGTCDGCLSSTVTVSQAIERAVREAAPEVAAIDVQGMVAAEPAGPDGRPLLPLQTVECPLPQETP